MLFLFGILVYSIHFLQAAWIVVNDVINTSNK